MNILLTNIWLVHHGGTEVGVRDMAIALHNRGVHVEVYSPELGPLAEEIERAGILVVNSAEKLERTPDLIHAQHFMPAMDAMLRFPDSPAIYMLHDRTHPADNPPKFSRILKYIAVDYNCLDRLIVDNGIEKKDTEILLNFVDTNRFKARKEIREKPLKALVFSNYANENNYYKEVEEACSKLGIELEGIGLGLGKVCNDPSTILLEYDLVFAKAKAAMESLATGAGVIVCDFRGLGGFVTMRNFDHFRKFNFGMKTLNQPITPELIMQEIQKYDKNEIRLASEKIRNEAAFSKYMDNLLILYNNSIKEFSLKKADLSLDFDENTIRKYLEIKSEAEKSNLRDRKPNPLEERIKLSEEKIKEQQKIILKLQDQIKLIKESWTYRTGRIMTTPFRFVYELFFKMKK